MIIVYSSLADEWLEIRQSILSENPELNDVLSENNTRIIDKASTGKKEELFESARYEAARKIIEYVNKKIKKEIYTSKYWLLEWILFCSLFLFLFVLMSFSFKFQSKVFVIFPIIIVFILFVKLVLLEKSNIKKLKNIRDDY